MANTLKITDFNIALAHLFYSLAIVDKTFEIDEKRRIVTIIENNWFNSSKTKDDKELVYETIRGLIKENTSSENSFSHFKVFFLANKDLISSDFIKKIIKASHSICEAFRSKNKAELILLTKIHKLLLPNHE